MHHHPELPMGGDLALLFGASVLGSAHCVAMCGPYVAMCSAQFVPRAATPMARFGLRLLFNLGRLATYCLIGLIAGAFGQIAQAAADRFGLSGLISIVAGTAALVFGLSIIGWMRDPSAMVATAGVTRLLVAFRSRASHAPAAAAPLLLGALQGWLPCALVYAAASRASLSGSATVGAATMLVFGLGTLPAVFALTVLPRPWLRRLRVHRFGGVLLAVLGVLLILRGLDQFGLVPSTGWW